MKKSIISIFLVMLFSSIVFSAKPPLTIYTEDNSAPLNFVEKGQLRGLSVEVVYEIMKRLGVSYKIEVVPWARGYDKLESTPNVMLFSTTLTNQRRKLFQWVGPVARIKWAFYAKKDSNIQINNLQDAKNIGRIGTYRDDAREQFLKKEGFTNLESVNSNVLNVRKLMRNRIDLMASSNVGISKTAIDAGYSRQDLREVFVIKTADLYLAFSSETPKSTVREWNKAFLSMINDGTFAAIYKRWMPGETIPR